MSLGPSSVSWAGSLVPVSVWRRAGFESPRGRDPREGQGPSQSMPRSRTQETLTSPPYLIPGRGLLSPLHHPAHGPNLKDQGWTSCMALGPGCPFLPKGPQQLVDPAQIPQFPGSPWTVGRVSATYRPGGAGAEYRRGWEPSSEPPSDPPQLGCGSMQGRVEWSRWTSRPQNARSGGGPGCS